MLIILAEGYVVELFIVKYRPHPQPLSLKKGEGSLCVKCFVYSTSGNTPLLFSRRGD
jgi:hypothetical protein